MLTSDDREAYALAIMEEVRRWPGIELRAHPSPTDAGQPDGVEFRLYGRQVGHVHADCSVHLPLTKAMKEWVIGEHLAQSLEVSPGTTWAMFNPMTRTDAAQAIWLLRLNYVRIRRQRLSPTAAAGSMLLREHEAALADLKPGVASLLQRTQARATRRPLPAIDASQLPETRWGDA